MLQCYVVAAATPTAFRNDESKKSRGKVVLRMSMTAQIQYRQET